MLTLLLWRRDLAPSWLENVFCRAMGSKEDCVEEDAREAGWSMVATAISDEFLELFVLERSRPFENRVVILGLTIEVIESPEQ